MAIIYKATNKINGKSYIGYDSNWPNRKRVHKTRAYNNHYTQQYFHKAIRKYGWKNFEWEILLEDATLEDEIRLISEYGTFGKNGYNLTVGGEGTFGYKHTKNAKNKMSSHERDYLLGNTHKKGKRDSIDTRERKSKARVGRKNPNFDITRKMILTDPKGEIYKPDVYQEFCKKHHLPVKTMVKFATGKKSKPYKGWTAIFLAA